MNNFQTESTASNHDITHKMHNGNCLDCQVFTDGANPPNITGGNTQYDAFGNKNKSKRINPKKERYSKFRKEKPSALSFASPELPEDVVQQRRQDEQRIGKFWRHYRRPPERFVRERDAKAKR